MSAPRPTFITQGISLLALGLSVSCATQHTDTPDASAVTDAAVDGAPTDLGTPVDVPGGIAAPRPTSPLSTAVVNTRRPTFRWVLAPGTDGAQVDVCTDRPCNAVVATLHATGTSVQPTQDLPPGVFFWRLHGQSGATVGASTSPTWQSQTLARNARAGGTWGTMLDINGDGIPDIAAGIPGTDPAMGTVGVFLGSTGGYGSPPTFTVQPPMMAPTHFGASVASGGDLNGDGYADLVVGATSEPVGDTSVGSVFVYPGSDTGIPTMPTATIPSPTLRSLFGASVAGVGDVNGDGYADLAVGAPGLQSVYVFYGGAMGVATVPSATLATAVANSLAGASVAAAGDVNGDGYADILVGDPGPNAGRGAAYVYLGSGTGPQSQPVSLPAPDPTDQGFGTAVAGVGDVNGDGLADIAVGAPGSPGYPGGDAGAPGTGRVYVYYGSTQGISFVGARLVAAGATRLGSSVAGGGDVNGDGVADIVAGAPGVATVVLDGGTGDGGVRDAGLDGGTDGGVTAMPGVGGAYVFHGGGGGVTPAVATVLPAMTAGTRRGWAVSIPGDYDGDLLFDVVVAEPSGAMGAGQFTVHHGGTTGVSVTAAATVAGTDPHGALGTALSR